MSSRVKQYLKYLQTLGQYTFYQEINKLGVYIKRKTSVQERRKCIDQLDLTLLQQYLAKMDATAATTPTKQNQPLSISLPLVKPELNDFYKRIVQIHQNYLNQYSSRIINTQIKPIQNSKSEQISIDDLLGIRTEVVIDPKRIAHQHQNDSKTLKNVTFSTFSEEQYRLRLKKARTFNDYWGEFSNIPKAEKHLLLFYGFLKEKEFFQESKNYLQELLFPPTLTVKNKKQYLMSKIISNFNEKEIVYGALMEATTLPRIIRLIDVFSVELGKLELNSTIIHNFTLAFCDFILNNTFACKAISSKNDSGQLILDWIIVSIGKYQSYLKYEDVDSASLSIFLQVLKRYSNIKTHLLRSFIYQVPSQVLLGTPGHDWPEKVITHLEMVPEVGVSQFQGRRVVQKLADVKLVFEFAQNEGLELPLSLLEKLLMSVRSGLEWMKMEEKQMKVPPLLTSELATFFGVEFCYCLIKIIFIHGEVGIDLNQLIAFLWTKFYEVRNLNETSIQAMYLLVNITIRYKCVEILKNDNKQIFSALYRSVETSIREDYDILKKEEVIDFLKEEATELLSQAQKQQLLDLIASGLTSRSKML